VYKLSRKRPFDWMEEAALRFHRDSVFSATEQLRPRMTHASDLSAFLRPSNFEKLSASPALGFSLNEAAYKGLGYLDISPEAQLQKALREFDRTARIMRGFEISPRALGISPGENLTAIPSAIPKTFIEQAMGLRRLGLRNEFEMMSALSSAISALRTPGFESTFVGRLATKLYELVEEGSDVQQFSEELDAAVRTRTADAAHSWIGHINWHQWIWNILSLLLPLYVTLQNSRHDEQMLQRNHDEMMIVLRQIAQRQLDSSTAKAPTGQPADLYVVVKATPLRSDRFNKAPQVSWLFPNQVVRLIRMSKAWVYVECFDNLEGIPRTGWMLKKALNKPRKQPDGTLPSR